MIEINFERAKSVVPMKTPRIRELKSTIMAESLSSLFVDQDTFFNSKVTSVINCLIFETMIVYLIQMYRPGRIRTLNPRVWSPSLYQLELQAYEFPQE